MSPALIRERGESRDLQRLLDPRSKVSAVDDQPFRYGQGHDTRYRDCTSRAQAIDNYRDHAGGHEPQGKKRTTARQVRGTPASRTLGEEGNSRTAAQAPCQGEPALFRWRRTQVHGRVSFNRSWRRRGIVAAVSTTPSTNAAPSNVRCVTCTTTRLKPKAA